MLQICSIIAQIGAGPNKKSRSHKNGPDSVSFYGVAVTIAEYPLYWRTPFTITYARIM
jgi:hypothetical protein